MISPVVGHDMWQIILIDHFVLFGICICEGGTACYLASYLGVPLGIRRIVFSAEKHSAGH